ncbi:MAG: tRNA (adenine(22)-N(1))-methyltransferase TrmK [Bdellovibrio sp.]|nr:tRNA (adenine(22)-N(1))-methyltransferase TrmK [Bdellovibrio sp.]
MLKLSPRLQYVYDLLLPGKPVWDFCCDHGHLGLNAFESGDFPEVYFVDQVESIIQRLRGRFEAYLPKSKSTAQAHFLAASGQDIETSVCGTVVIAGVGAYTILGILQGVKEKGHLQAERLILGPQRDEEKLRQFAKEILGTEYEISSEYYEVTEGRRTLQLLVFNRI